MTATDVGERLDSWETLNGAYLARGLAWLRDQLDHEAPPSGAADHSTKAPASLAPGDGQLVAPAEPLEVGDDHALPSAHDGSWTHIGPTRIAIGSNGAPW